MSGRLFVVAGPIGNLEDVTLRALRVLGEVDLILAEDTRIARRLLSRYDIHVRVESCHAHTSPARIASFVELLKAGKNLALVTDAGTPGVSDPGEVLVAAAVAAGIEITPIPGPSAATAMISIAAVPDGRYIFEGFVPRTRGARRRLLERLVREDHAVVLYESPARIKDTLVEILHSVGDRRVAIGRELTKYHEEVYRGTASGAIEWLGSDKLRGEFTVVLYPPDRGEVTGEPADKSEALDATLREALAQGMSTREAVRHACASLGVPRKAAYERALALRSELESRHVAGDATNE